MKGSSSSILEVSQRYTKRTQKVEGSRGRTKVKDGDRRVCKGVWNRLQLRLHENGVPETWTKETDFVRRGSSDVGCERGEESQRRDFQWDCHSVRVWCTT